MQLRVCGGEGVSQRAIMVVYRAPPGEWGDVRELSVG
jgi:hypothetical protein